MSIAHHGTIIINRGAKIGLNCRLHAGVNIGTKAGYANFAPRIVNNVYIEPCAKLFGDILLGNNIAIGANAVVTKSFPESGVAIAGAPAKVIAPIDIREILIDATGILNNRTDTTPFRGKPAREIAQMLRDAEP